MPGVPQANQYDRHRNSNVFAPFGHGSNKRIIAPKRRQSSGRQGLPIPPGKGYDAVNEDAVDDDNVSNNMNYNDDNRFADLFSQGSPPRYTPPTMPAMPPYTGAGKVHASQANTSSTFGRDGSEEGEIVENPVNRAQRAPTADMVGSGPAVPANRPDPSMSSDDSSMADIAGCSGSSTVRHVQRYPTMPARDSPMFVPEDDEVMREDPEHGAVAVKQEVRSLLATDLEVADTPASQLTSTFQKQADKIAEQRDLDDQDYYETPRDDQEEAYMRSPNLRSRGRAPSPAPAPETIEISSDEEQSDTEMGDSDNAIVSPTGATKRRSPGAEDRTPKKIKGERIRSFATRYVKLKGPDQKRRRDDLVSEIEGIWNCRINSVVPSDIKPRGTSASGKDVPFDDPRDWSTPLLEATTRLAMLTRNKPGVVAKVLRRAVEQQVSKNVHPKNWPFVAGPADIDLAIQILHDERLAELPEQLSSQMSIQDSQYGPAAIDRWDEARPVSAGPSNRQTRPTATSSSSRKTSYRPRVSTGSISNVWRDRQPQRRKTTHVSSTPNRSRGTDLVSYSTPDTPPESSESTPPSPGISPSSLSPADLVLISNFKQAVQAEYEVSEQYRVLVAERKRLQAHVLDKPHSSTELPSKAELDQVAIWHAAAEEEHAALEKLRGKTADKQHLKAELRRRLGEQGVRMATPAA